MILPTLFATRCSWLFSTASSRISGVDIWSTCWLIIRLSPNIESSKVLMVVIIFDLSLQVEPCYCWRVQNSCLTWCPCLSRALVENTPKEWNSLLHMDLAMFQRWLSLSVAILTKLFQEVTHRSQLSILHGQHAIIFVIWAR